MELSVFVGRAAEMAHDLRPNCALRRNHEAQIVLQGFLEKKSARLPIFRGQFGELLIEPGIHLQADFSGVRFGHEIVPSGMILDCEGRHV